MPISTDHTTTTAADLRVRLGELERERTTARLAGVADGDLLLDDLRAELTATRAAYVGAAVTEIALLRASLAGPLAG